MTEGLGLVRDLLEDLSGAETCHLILLGDQGPALRVMAGEGSGAVPRCARDVDPDSGILGQVLLTGEIVIMEERLRLAGQSRTRHFSRLYVPLGSPECFAVFVAEFEGLSTLSHFQRNLSQVQTVITPRLGRLLGREESRGRMKRLKLLAQGLSELGTLAPHRRAEQATRLLQDLTSAACVAYWDSNSAAPRVLVGAEGLEGTDTQRLWSEIQSRRAQGRSVRLSEMDPAGIGLRSLLLVSEAEGPAIAAFQRQPQQLLEDLGFREEDLDAAWLLLQGMTTEESAASGENEITEERRFGTPSESVVSADPTAFTANRLLLREALERELQRAQRYHFGFSLTCFQLASNELDASRVARLVDRVLAAARSTDCVLFIGRGRFAILAPEESRGQRRLARRYREVLENFAADEGIREGSEIRNDHSRYPHDADGPDDLLRRSQVALGPAPD